MARKLSQLELLLTTPGSDAVILVTTSNKSYRYPLSSILSDVPDGSITSSKLGSGAVTNIKILDTSVSTSKIADGAVTTPKYADLSITGGKIAAGTITADKLDANALNTLTLSSLKSTYTQAGHGFNPGSCVFRGAAGWQGSLANSLTTLDVDGVVETVNGNSFTIVTHGIILLPSTLISANTKWWLSTTSLGLLTSTMPNTPGFWRKQILRSLTVGVGMVNISPIEEEI
jgi:hypothetical protein